MSKGLKALKEIKDELCCGCVEECCSCPYSIKLLSIEKELKEYEEMKRIKGTTTLDNALEETLINACPNVAKKVKALEIIKNKKVDIKYLYYRVDFNLEKYNDNYIETLTQEECDLLKEILL